VVPALNANPACRRRQISLGRYGFSCCASVPLSATFRLSRGIAVSPYWPKMFHILVGDSAA
jgi:hypothetical protein